MSEPLKRAGTLQGCAFFHPLGFLGDIMNGKKILSLFMLLSLALSAFRPPMQPRLDSNPKIVVQWLTIIHADGSSEYNYILKINSESLQLLRSTSSFSESTLCHDVFQSMENTVITFQQEQHGEAIWCTYKKRLDDLPALEAQWKDDFDHLTVRRLEIKGGTFTSDISWTAFPCSSPDTSTLACEWSIQMPGKIGDNNATRVEGTTLTWDMSASGTPYHFTAQSAIGGSTSNLWIVLAVLMCGCCLVIVVIGGAIAAYFILRNKKPVPAAPAPIAALAPVLPAGPPLQP
jgi:hypothetical protein